MTNSDLEKLLRAAELPEHGPEYWEEFPKRIEARLHWQSRDASARLPQRPKKVKFALGLAGVAISILCVVGGFAVGFWKGRYSSVSPSQLAIAQKCFSEVEALFPNQVQAIVFDREGTHLILSKEADIPYSTPIYLRLQTSRGTKQIVTFSGQQVQVDGELCDVLLDTGGHVILAGSRIVWSSVNPTAKAGPYRVEAQSLKERS